MGAHGLPLIGTGDWNDGLDEIGSQGKGESVWLGFFLYAILEQLAGIIERKEGPPRSSTPTGRGELKDAVELTWRDDRYLRAIHDDGTEIGVEGERALGSRRPDGRLGGHVGHEPRAGPDRLSIRRSPARTGEYHLARLAGPPRTQAYLGRSSRYPAGVRENGMYCHGVQWLISAARLAEHRGKKANPPRPARIAETTYRLWLKISPLPHTAPEEIETYGGQPNKQAADMLTTFDPGRMMWNGYTGAAGWMSPRGVRGSHRCAARR